MTDSKDPNAAKEGGIQVIGPGLPRTGTSSLQAALTTLGYDPTHHMVTDILSSVSGRGAMWMRAWDEPNKAKRHAIIRSILAPYKAIVDYPACVFLPDLLEIYPDAKVILTTRSSPEQWRASFSRTLDLTYTPWWYISTFMLPSTRFLVLKAAPKWEAVNKERYDGATVYRTESVEIYKRHNAWVRELVPEQDKLLTFEPGMGWGPLCNFLGKDVPDQAYPRLFDTKENRKWFMIGAAMGLGMWAAGLGVIGGALWYGRKWAYY